MQPLQTFTLFPSLPVELRRKIWCLTLGPATLTFTKNKPDIIKKYSPDYEVIGCIPYGYFGFVALADGSSYMRFVIRRSNAYIACKESRAFLQYFFAEPVREGGGLPSWFRFEIDTIWCDSIDTIGNHTWFSQTQHLTLKMWDNEFYFHPLYEEFPDAKGDIWVQTNLTSLKTLTFELANANTYDMALGPGYQSHWLSSWWSVFEQWYNPDYVQASKPFYARVISRTVPEEEWLTPTNYVRVRHMVLKKMMAVCYSDIDWREEFADASWWDFLDSDLELDNPTEFFKEQRQRREQRWRAHPSSFTPI